MKHIPYIVVTIAVIIAIGIIFIAESTKKPNIDLNLETISPAPSVSESTSPSPSFSMTETPQNSQLDELMKRDEINATISTPAGSIDVVLYPKVAPKTVASFLDLSLKGFYDGLKFHRVVPGFVAQGGDPLSRTNDPAVGTGGPGYQFEDEINPKSLGLPDNVIKSYESAGYKYNYELKSLPVDVGALAMANSGPNTNGSQFFIVTDQNQPHLYGKHTVFGVVKKGLDIARKVKQGDTMKIKISQ